MASDKLKILCLHGYRQNGQIFRERTGSFRKITKSYADLVYVSAPHVVPPSEDIVNQDHRGWWFSRTDDYFSARDESDCCKGFDESVKVVQKIVEDEGPFDGVLGFSQGAAMAALMCGLQEQDEDSPFKFRFAIFISGFQSRSSPHSKLYTQLISIPSLHVYGATDQVIPRDMSEDLLQYFPDPQTLLHPGGHFVPASGEQKKVYHNFLQQMQKHL